jgi:hypothetical protein
LVLLARGSRGIDPVLLDGGGTQGF